MSRMVEIIGPFDQKPIASIPVKNGAVATSGIYARLWLDKNNKPSHHLLDPSNGEPAWTGIISASAIAKTALEAETLAKMALLSGPEKARELLAPLGGVVVHQNRQIEKINLPVQTPKITFRKKP
jgi:thiamine biosynthesis lipoprotein